MRRFALALLLVYACPAWATDYYIDPARELGDHAECGDESNFSDACRTIDYAINTEAVREAAPPWEEHNFIIKAGSAFTGVVVTPQNSCAGESRNIWINIKDKDCKRCSVYSETFPATGDAALDGTMPWPISESLDVTFDMAGDMAFNIDNSDHWTIRGMSWGNLSGRGGAAICNSTGTIIEGNYLPFTYLPKAAGREDIAVQNAPSTTIEHNRLEVVTVDSGTCSGNVCTGGRLAASACSGSTCANGGVFAGASCSGAADCSIACDSDSDCDNQCVTVQHGNRIVGIRGVTSDDFIFNHNYVPQHAQGVRIGTERRNHGATTDYITNAVVSRNYFGKGSEHGLTLKSAARYVLVENNVWAGDPDCTDCEQGVAGKCGVTCKHSEMKAGMAAGKYDRCYRGTRSIDVYEADFLTVRNNTILGYDYHVHSPLGYIQSAKAQAIGCDYSNEDPGLCKFLTAKTCCSAGSPTCDFSTCPGRCKNDNAVSCTADSPDCDAHGEKCIQPCLGKCDHHFNYWYNNHAYDPQNTIGGLDTLETMFFNGKTLGGTFSEAGVLRFDFNYYNGLNSGQEGVAADNDMPNFRCGGGSPQNEYTLWGTSTPGAWNHSETTCYGATPDVHSTHSAEENVTWFVDLANPETIANLAPTEDAPWPDAGSTVETVTYSGCTGDDQCPGGTCKTATSECTIPYCAPVDIVGNSRLDGMCDPGAFERQTDPEPLPAVTRTCIPPAHGVPGVSHRQPHWWDNTPSQPVYYEQLDDPRWRGAAKISFATGTEEAADFRALHHDDHLYLSWRLFEAPASTPEQNVLFFGYRRASGDDVIVRINLKTLASTKAGDGLVHDTVAFLRKADGSEGVPVSLPMDVQTTQRVWINNPTDNSWAVQLRIPVSELEEIAGDHKLWFELLGGFPTLPVHKYTWPRSGVDVVTVGGAESYPDPALWARFRPSTGPTDASCPSVGVSLDWNQIGTTNSPESTILYSASAPQPVNTFFARPRNETGDPGDDLDAGVTIPKDGLKATFRIANWGSVPGDWEEGVDIDTLWSKIPGGENVSNGGPIAEGDLADASSDMRFDWKVETPDLEEFQSGQRRRHQCMLVELRSTMAPGLVFTNSSVYRNMNFEEASTFSHEADISVVGLAPLSPDDRDVYLYVEALNMPAKVNPDRGSGLSLAPATTPSLEELQEMLNSGTVTPEELDRWLPAYRVHVYHDTGKVLTLGGVDRPVLSAQTSFGYYVVHEGQLEGWRHRITGPKLEELAPNWYRIPVPNNDFVTVTTTIEAIEPSPWSLSVHAGNSDPRGTVGNLCNGENGYGIDLEYVFNPRFAAELFYGRDKFDCSGADVEIDHLSLNGKAYFRPGPTRVFAVGGVTRYDFSPGSSEAGFNVGVGSQFNPWSSFALEVTAKYYKVSDGPDFDFVTYQAGARYRF